MLTLKIVVAFAQVELRIFLKNCSKGEMFKLRNIVILRNFENEDRIIRILVLHCLMLV
jgi:hypothetical protein